MRISDLSSDVCSSDLANHLTYLCDVTVGANANIGAGTITCNYDGYFKYRTEIGERAFIGSNSALVAPVRIGADAIVAAGSAVTRDVADGELRRVRGEQLVKPGWADRFHDAMRKKKAAEKKQCATAIPTSHSCASSPHGRQQEHTSELQS